MGSAAQRLPPPKPTSSPHAHISPSRAPVPPCRAHVSPPRGRAPPRRVRISPRRAWRRSPRGRRGKGRLPRHTSPTGGRRYFRTQTGLNAAVRGTGIRGRCTSVPGRRAQAGALPNPLPVFSWSIRSRCSPVCRDSPSRHLARRFIRAGQPFVRGVASFVRAGEAFVRAGESFVRAGQATVHRGRVICPRGPGNRSWGCASFVRGGSPISRLQVVPRRPPP